MSIFMQKNTLRNAIALLIGAASVQAGQAYAVVPTYNIVWLGLGSDASSNGSYAEDINNNNQIVGYSYNTTETPTGPGSATLFYNWRHSTIWTPPASVASSWNLTEVTNAAFQPCTLGVLSVGYICPDITSASAINDNGLVVGMANVPSPTSYFLPSGSGWDHSYYYDFTNNGSVLPVPTTYGVNIGHYDYAIDVNNSGTVLGFMDGVYYSSIGWSTVGYLYTPGNTQVRTLAQPVLSNGRTSDIAYTSGLSDADANGATTVVGYGSISTPSSQGGYTFTYRPVIWQGNAAGQEIPGFSLASATQWSFAQEINNLGQVVGYSQDAADVSNIDYARLYNTNNQQTVTLGVGQGTHINNRGTVTITNYQNYPYGGGFVFYPDAANAQSGQTCQLDANTVPTLAVTPSDHIDSAKSINDNGYIVGGGTHNGQPEAYVLIPTATPAANQTCTQVTSSGSTGGTTPPPIAAISFSPTLPNATQGIAYSASLTASGGVAPFTYSSPDLPTGLSINGSNIVGKPSVSGEFQVTITATDSTGASIDAIVPLSISAPAIVFNPTLPSGTQGVTYSATLSASGGVAPFTYTASGLPTGLSLIGDNVTGTPSVAGSFQVVLTATDSKGTTVNSTVTLSIGAASSGSTTTCTLPAGAKSAPDIHAKLTAVNGKQLTIGNKLVTLLDCAKVTYKGTAKAPVVGYDADANKGYILNGVTYTTSIIIDNGK